MNTLSPIKDKMSYCKWFANILFGRETVTKFLCIHIDKNLSWKDHKEHVSNEIFKKIEFCINPEISSVSDIWNNYIFYLFIVT